MNDIANLNLDYFDRGLAQTEIAEFWREWRFIARKGGKLSEFSPRLLDMMTISKGYAGEGVSPAILSVGRNSYAATFYGQEWAQNAPILTTIPDMKLEKFAAPGYHKAFAGDPSIDIIRANTRDQFDRPCILTYERAIAPIRTNSGRLLTLCMTAPVKPVELLCWPGDQGHPPSSSTSNHRPGYA